MRFLTNFRNKSTKTILNPKIPPHCYAYLHFFNKYALYFWSKIFDKMFLPGTAALGCWVTGASDIAISFFYTVLWDIRNFLGIYKKTKKNKIWLKKKFSEKIGSLSGSDVTFLVTNFDILIFIYPWIVLEHLNSKIMAKK